MSVTANVQHRDIPPIPPKLASFVEPVTLASDLLGYRLDPAAVLSHAGPDAYAARGDFFRWRESFMLSRDLGPRALVESARTLITQMAHEHDEYLGILQEADFSYTALPADEAEILVTELRLARDWLAQSNQRGWGLVDASRSGQIPRRGLLAGGIALAGSVVVTATGAAEVCFEQGRGLFLREAGRDTEVTEFVLTGSGRMVRNATGEFQVSADASQALSKLAPTSTAVRVIAAPLTSIFADFLVGLDEAGRFAVAHARPLVVTDQL